MKLNCLLPLLLVTQIAALQAAIYNVIDADGIDSLPNSLAAGDEVILADGTYANVIMKITAAGTTGNPVRIYAQNPGKVFFSGGAAFELMGSHVIISGLAFDGDTVAGGPGRDSGIFRFNAGSSDITLRDCLFRNFNAGSPDSGAFWIQINGYRHTIEYCSFIGKTSEDPIINIIPNEDEDASGFPTKDVPRRHLIRYCYFADRTVIGLNGYEAIRIGESQYQMYDFSSIVEYCLFKRAIYGEDVSKNEPEIISSKSRNNIYRYNTFVENKGGLVLRHGDDNVIDGNFFFGEPGSTMGAGIRIIGLRHIVRNNYLENVDGSSLRAAICLMKGTGEFSDDSTSNGYESPGTTRIFNNTIVNCNQPFALGATTSSSGTTAPKNVEIRNNIIQSEEGDGNVIEFNAENGWQISDIVFSGNQAYHPSAKYGTLPASGFTTDTSLNLVQDAKLGYRIPAAGSPAIDAATATPTTPPTLYDIRSKLRVGPPFDAGSFDSKATGASYNKPLKKADVGPVYDGRTDANRVPTLTVQPDSQSAFTGAAVTLSATAESSQPMTYQWMKNEIEIEGETKSTLSIPSAAVSDEGSYTLAVMNASGRTVCFPAVLSITSAAPLITSQPVSKLASIGGKTSFMVAVEGIPPFTYQWKKNGAPIDGATGATLDLAAVQDGDAADYAVVITNAKGSATSETATLSIASGGLLLNDGFTDNDHSNQALPDSAKWYSSSGKLEIKSGALSAPIGRHSLVFFKDSGVLELAVEEQITATFTLSFSAVGNSSGGLRFGLFNSNGAVRPPDSNNKSFSGYDGYIFTTTAAFPDSSAGSDGPMVIKQKNPGTGSSLISTTGKGIYTDVASSPATSQGFVAGVNYTVTLTIKRIAETTLSLSLAVSGGELSNYGFRAEDAAGIVTGFDSFAILSTQTNGSAFTIDNVTIVHDSAR